MKKHLLFLFAFLLAVIGAKADEVSFSVPDISISPGETKEISLVMVSTPSDKKFNFNGEIILSTGLTFVSEQIWDEDAEEYVTCYAFRTERLKAGHVISENLKATNDLSFLVSAGTKFLSYKEGDAVITFKVKAADDIALGDATIKLKDMSAAGEEAIELVTQTDYTAKVTVAKECTIVVTSSNEKFGTVATNPTGQSTYPTGTSMTLTATPVDGYKFVNWTSGETELSKDNPYVFTVSDNANIVGNFAPNKYTITFDTKGGSEVAPIIADYGAEVKAPTAPTKDGYTFAGWNPAMPETMPLNGATLEATWTPIEYTITYNLDGGAVETANPTSYTIESEAITLNNPTKEGYTFAGWTGTGIEQATAEVTIPAGSMGNREYTATWTINKYTITFDSKGGSEVAPIIADYGAEVKAPAAPTKDGYTFAGWNPAMPETMPLNGATLEATWTPVEYTLTYNLDGGAVETANPTSYTIESEAITLNNPTKEGYTFAGWTGTGIEQATAEVTIAKGSTGNRTYTATWNVNQYTMTFVLGNGEENIVKVQDFGSELTAPADPKWEEHNFLGWTPAVPQTVPASDQTFTAQWDVIKYKLTFINGELIIKQEDLEKGAAVVAPNDPTKDGYTFAGWNPALPETMPGNDLTLTATWTPVQYSITYNLDGGSVATENPTSYTIESKDITLNNPTKEGYTFEGWTGTGLEQATIDVTIQQGSTGNRSYTATWKVIEVEPIKDETSVDISTLSNENLQNNVVNDVYYNLGEGAYDSTDKSVVIGQSTDMQQITDKTPGSNDISSKFNGLIIKVGSGKGSITVNTKTSGNAAIAIQIGNGTPTTAQKAEQGDVKVDYEVTEDTYVYIYGLTSNNGTNGLSITATEDIVKVYSITVTPGTTGISIIKAFENAEIDTLYDLNGRKLETAPVKGGIYILNGQKVIVK